MNEVINFKDRKSKYKKIQKIDSQGYAVSESFYALITDEVVQEGTPLNAENMNYAISFGKDAFDNLNNLRNPTTGRIDSLQNIISNLCSLITRPFAVTAKEYDDMDITALDYSKKNITAVNFDMRGKSFLN